MSRRHVALLTQQRRALFQHGRVVAAMRVMAQSAVLRGRRMFPQKRATFFRMACVTGVVDRVLRQLKIIETAVRIVTAGAGHLAEAQRVTAGLVRLRPGPWMAAITGLLLGFRVEHRIPLDMHLVARRTRQFLFLVSAADPAHPAMVGMAAQANLVLFLDGRFDVLAEHPHWRGVLAARLSFVRTAGPVACFTLGTGKGTAGIAA